MFCVQSQPKPRALARRPAGGSCSLAAAAVHAPASICSLCSRFEAQCSASSRRFARFQREAEVTGRRDARQHGSWNESWVLPLSTVWQRSASAGTLPVIPWSRPRVWGRVRRPIHLPHSPGADQADDFIDADGCPDLILLSWVAGIISASGISSRNNSSGTRL